MAKKNSKRKKKKLTQLQIVRRAVAQIAHKQQPDIPAMIMRTEFPGPTEVYGRSPAMDALPQAPTPRRTLNDTLNECAARSAALDTQITSIRAGLFGGASDTTKGAPPSTTTMEAAERICAHLLAIEKSIAEISSQL